MMCKSILLFTGILNQWYKWVKNRKLNQLIFFYKNDSFINYDEN